MHLTLPRFLHSKSLNGKSPSAAAEINAYIAIRDNLLEQAEEMPSSAKVSSAAIANEFVENCLRTARAIYRAEYLPNGEASRERKRCEQVKNRIGELRQALAR